MPMSQNGFISDSDRALADFIWNCIENEPSLKKLVSSRDQISFSSPRNAGQTNKLSIFLYNITVKAEPNSCVLHYLVTPLTRNDIDDHALLEKIIQLASTSITTADNSGNIGFTVKINPLSLDDLTKLWVALSAPLRLCVALEVSCGQKTSAASSSPETAAANAVESSQEAPVNTERMTQLYQSVLKTFTEQMEGWNKRNIVLRQWTQQDFRKTTDMTIDEMLSSLNNLGDRLQQHGLTDQFVKPLNQLTKYYEHQLSQLDGMQKVSRNQDENLALISGWIKDAKELLKALNPPKKSLQ
jgi:hypothetical protein